MEGRLIATNLKFAIISSKFNELFTQNLVKGATNALNQHDASIIDTVWVPGVFEIPLLVKQVAKQNKYDAIITLGCVIKGETDHYQYICNTVSGQLANLSIEYNIPVLFGILTTHNIEQSIERSGTKNGNKGYDVALSAIEMANLMKDIA